MPKIGKHYQAAIEMALELDEYSGRLVSKFKQRRLSMKKNAYLTVALAGLLLGTCVVLATEARTASSAKNAFRPDAIPYGPAPAFVPAGAQLAVLEGDPGATSGDYTVRLKMPSGYRIPPHWHPQRENVTVISGTFKVGMGDHFDESKMEAFPAGSFAYLDPDMHHYAMASGEVVVQVHGQSPVQFNYVNPKDDPSRKK
jgi:hypothetical protein